MTELGSCPEGYRKLRPGAMPTLVEQRMADELLEGIAHAAAEFPPKVCDRMGHPVGNIMILH